jgi:16S rRNA (uracil1498-N3)-methyltransferase
VNLFYQPLIPEGVHYLDAEESRHCVKVLRKTEGDQILITDGKGLFYSAKITGADSQKCKFEILEKTVEAARTYAVHIAISPTKNADRIEWFVEKATELGIDRITLLECKNTERAYLKSGRLEKVALSAMKQSLKARVPEIRGITQFKDLISDSTEDERFIAFVDHTNPNHLQSIATPNKAYVVMIGPEGDFTPEELMLAEKAGFKKVSLGNTRLRTETAGMAACHILNLINS